MDPVPSTSGRVIKNAGTGVLLLAVVAGGVLVLLFFVKELLRPGDLNALTLPLVALVAGITAVFNALAMPATSPACVGAEWSIRAGMANTSTTSLATSGSPASWPWPRP